MRASATTFGSRRRSATQVENWIPRIPNIVWLAMLTLGFMALSVGTFYRAQNNEQEAIKSHASVTMRVEDARAVNKQLKRQTEQVKTNPAIAAQKAQERMRMVRPNEVVVARP